MPASAAFELCLLPDYARVLNTVSDLSFARGLSPSRVKAGVQERRCVTSKAMSQMLLQLFPVLRCRAQSH